MPTDAVAVRLQQFTGQVEKWLADDSGIGMAMVSLSDLELVLSTLQALTTERDELKQKAETAGQQFMAFDKWMTTACGLQYSSVVGERKWKSGVERLKAHILELEAALQQRTAQQDQLRALARRWTERFTPGGSMDALAKEYAGNLLALLTMNNVLRPTDFSAVEPWSAEALKEHVRIIDMPDTRWFLIVDGTIPIGCIALYIIDGRTQIKGAYVVPCSRGRGFGTRATEAVLALALNEGRPVEAYALNPAWYHARGFKTVNYNENGIALVRRDAPDGKAETP